MVAAPSIVKTHNNGIVHQKIVQEHYQQFKDPETILAEESKKKPCTRFANGQCQFGSICRFSHYSQAEINALKEYVASKQASKSDVVYPSFIDMVRDILSEKTNKTEESRDGNTIVYDNNGVTYVFPWTYNPVIESYGEDLPPSVKRFKIDDFKEANIVTWG